MNKQRKILYSCFLLAAILIFGKTDLVKAEVQPRVIISEYEIVNDGIAPGESSQLVLKIKNMSFEYSVESVLITCTMESDETGSVSAEYGSSNQIYIESLEPTEEKVVSLSLQASDSIDTDCLDGYLNISYTDEVVGNTSSDAIINVPIIQDYIMIQKAYVPKSAILGLKSRISITCENTTNEDLYNVIMTVRGVGIEEQSIDLGTILSGSRKNQEMYFRFETLGEKNISVEYYYEDSKGNPYLSKTQSYGIRVLSDEEAKENGADLLLTSQLNKISNIKQGACAIAILLCLVGIVATIRKSNKQ